MRKVFGIGWAKTGTTTLGECLRTLGFRHTSHRFELVGNLVDGALEPVFSVADEFDSFEDWPWILLYKELDARYPDSRFVLTHRRPESWLQSYRNMLAKRTVIPEHENVRRRILYGLPFPNVTDEQLVKRYLRHNSDVRAYFRDKESQLLEVNWSEGDDWERLCRFLELPVPAIDFPHANRGKYTPKRRWPWQRSR